MILAFLCWCATALKVESLALLLLLLTVSCFAELVLLMWLQQLAESLGWQPMDSLVRLEGFRDPWEFAVYMGRNVNPAVSLKANGIATDATIAVVRRVLIPEVWKVCVLSSWDVVEQHHTSVHFQADDTTLVCCALHIIEHTFGYTVAQCSAGCNSTELNQADHASVLWHIAVKWLWMIQMWSTWASVFPAAAKGSDAQWVWLVCAAEHHRYAKRCRRFIFRRR